MAFVRPRGLRLRGAVGSARSPGAVHIDCLSFAEELRELILRAVLAAALLIESSDLL